MFHVGDRVRCVSISSDSERVLGQTGTVKVFDGYRLGVEWDIEFDGGHSLSRRGTRYAKEGHGWWVNDCCVELVEEEDGGDPVDGDAFTKLLWAF